MNNPVQKTLSEISKAGAQISIHNDTLKITPVSVLPQGIVESVRENKHAILEMLQPIVFPPAPVENADQTRAILQQFDTEVIYITNTQAAEDVIQNLNPDGLPVGLDIETAPKCQYRDKWQPIKITKQGKPAARQLKQDNSEIGLDPYRSDIRLVQLHDGSGQVYVLDMLSIDWKVMHRLNTLTCVSHNAQFEARFLQQQNITPVGLQCSLILGAHVYGKRLSLANAVEETFDITVPKSLQVSDWTQPELSMEQIEYAALDAVLTRELFKAYWGVLEEDQKSNYRITQQAIIPVSKMELAGMPIDKKAHQQLMMKWQQKIAELEPIFIRATGIQNPKSSQQVHYWLEQTLPADLLENWPRTNTGKLSSGKDTLQRGAVSIESLRPLMELKKLYTLVKSFGQSLSDKINPVTGRLHGNITLCGAKTGRFTSSEPNLQQMPREDTAKGMRAIFKAPEDRLLVVADYSQAEIRAGAEIAMARVEGAPGTIREAYRNGIDIHAMTAAAMTGKPLSDITKEERQAAKAVNFGLMFGMGAPTLRAYAFANYGVEMSIDESEEARAVFFETYPEFALWHELWPQESEMIGYTGTPMGRRHFWDWEYPNEYGEHFRYTLALNLPVQGGIAEVAQIAVTRIDDKLKVIQGNPRLICQVHDEYIVECDNTPEVIGAVKSVMEKEMTEAFLDVFPDAPVNGLVEAKYGESWAQAK